MEDYEYLPLEHEFSIRLLKLLKGDKVEVEGEIFHAKLDDQTTYEALSYTWGTPDLVEHIKLNDKRLWTTENLHSALQCLRYHDRDRILWIDAICIDQLNLTERSQQVQKMGTIFGQAQRVIFWLGKPTAEAACLFESLGEFQLATASTIDQDLDVQEPPCIELSLNGLKIQKQPLRHRRGLQFLLSKSWFKRVWILQEVANAKSAVVCSGRWSVPAHLFTLAPLLLEVPVDEHVRLVLDSMPGPARKNSWWTWGREMYDLLIKFRTSEASDMRDLIFALLCLSSESTKHSLLQADYTKPIETVVHDSVRYLLGQPSVSIDQVLDYLTSFDTLDILYLIPASDFGPDDEMERHNGNGAAYILDEVPPAGMLVDVMHVIETCNRDPALFWIEQNRTKATENRNRIFSELDILRHHTSPPRDGRGVRVFSWKVKGQNVQIMVVEHVRNALRLAGLFNCQTIFNIIVDNYGGDREMLLNHILDMAFWDRHQATIDFTLDKGADVRARWGSSNVLFENAFSNLVSRGYKKEVQDLLEQGVHVDSGSGWHRYALIDAAAANQREIVKILLDHGANIDGVGSEGTALCVASRHDYREIVRMLLERGADIDAQGGYGGHGRAIQVAARSEHWEVVGILLDHGSQINGMDQWDETVLQIASRHGCMKVVVLLLNRGADIHPVGPHGNALHCAANAGHADVLHLLLERGANINETYVDGTPLHMAAFRGHEDVARILIDNGADINAGESGRGTPIQQASRSGKIEMVRLLIEKGADVNEPGGTDEYEHGSALYEACLFKHEEVVQLLLDHGADVNLETGACGTALCAAIASNQREIVKLLIKHGADVNSRGRHDSPLLQAQRLRKEHYRTGMSEILLAHGAKY